MAHKVSDRGLVEIAAHEGIVNAPYFDSVGVLTVGIGHTAAAGSPDPATERREFTVAEIMAIFERDIARFEARVRKAFSRPLTQEQFDAAVSFDFNCGGIDTATWVKKFNAGDQAGAKKAFMNWRKPAEIIPRRKKERELFFDGTYSGNGSATMWPANLKGQVLWSHGHRVDVLAILRAQEATSAPEMPSTPTSPETAETPRTGKGGAGKGIAALVIAGIVAAGAWLSSSVCDWFGLFCG